jgi:alpha-D-xyloside xylohydrolase
LPVGTDWTNFWTGEKTIGGQEINTPVPIETIPLFVRAGAIVPLGPALQYASEQPAESIELRVYRGADGAFTLYENDGDSYRYEKGVFASIPITWNEQTQTLVLGQRKGQFAGMLNQRTFRIVWVKPSHGTELPITDNADEDVTYQGKAMTVRAPRP